MICGAKDSFLLVGPIYACAMCGSEYVSNEGMKEDQRVI